jgi:hypothetical protein
MALAVWSAMTQAFGRRWVTEMGDEPHGLWIEALRKVPEDQVRRGIDRLATFASPFMPTLGQFVELCMKADSQPGRPEWTKAPAIAPAVARVNQTLLSFVTARAKAGKPVDTDTLRQLVREKNRIARQTDGVTDPEYDDMRPGIITRFREITA